MYWKILLLAFACFTSLAQGQSASGDDVQEVLVSINIDDPYQLDVEFLETLWGDAYARKFIPGQSAMWIGDHLDDDLSEPQRAILMERSGDGTISNSVDPDHVSLDVIARHRVEWVDEVVDQYWTTLTDPWTQTVSYPIQLQTAEYEDALVVRIHLPDGTSRIVVGFSKIININILNPGSEQTAFTLENFWPLKRFFSEAQANNYASQYADAEMGVDLSDVGIVIVANDPCASYTGVAAEYCYCLLDIQADFDADMNNCNFPPGGFDTALKGGGAGFGVGAVASGLWSKIAQKATSVYGYAATIATTTVVGAGTGYAWEVHACKTRAKSNRDARRNKARNSARKAINTGSSFECPADEGPVGVED